MVTPKMKGQPLTDGERAMLREIARYWREYGYAPSLRDIQQGLAISSTSVVSYRLHALEAREPRITRSVRIVGPLDTWEAA